MAAEHLYFYEDEVFRLNKKGSLELGMVLQNSEHLSSDEEDDEYEGTVRNGYIRVAWHPSGVEEVLQEKRVCIFHQPLTLACILQDIKLLSLRNDQSYLVPCVSLPNAFVLECFVES